MTSNTVNGVDPYAVFFIAYKSKILIRMPIFTSDDYEDIQQELMLAYLHAWPKFDSAKGDRRSFIKTVVNTKALMLVRDAERQKRWTGVRTISLFTPVSDDENSTTLADIIDHEGGLWGSVFQEHSQIFAEQRLDIRRMLAVMPDDLRQSYHVLLENSVSEAAIILGIPRTTMSSRLKKLKEFVGHYMSKK